MATLAQASDHKNGAPLRTLARTLLMLTALPSALAVAGCSAAVVSREVADYATATAAPAHRYAAPHSHRFRALLAPQPAPDCEFKGSDVGTLDKDLWARLKLDYERHCYQHAETLVRDRLRQLQQQLQRQSQVSGLCEIEPVRHRRLFTRHAADKPETVGGGS